LLTGPHDPQPIQLGIDAATKGDNVIFRHAHDPIVQRQTLRRLPRTRDILFTIRVHVRPLCELATRPDRAAELASTIRSMPEPMRLYKSLPPFLDAALGWLDRVAASHSENSSPAV